jgi:hypothetical protein
MLRHPETVWRYAFRWVEIAVRINKQLRRCGGRWLRGAGREFDALGAPAERHGYDQANQTKMHGLPPSPSKASLKSSQMDAQSGQIRASVLRAALTPTLDASPGSRFAERGAKEEPT